MGALLPDAGAVRLAENVTAALTAVEIPAVAEPARRGDWRLAVVADLRGDKVVPRFVVQNPAGEPQGSTEGAPVDAAAWAAGAPDELKRSADGAAPRIARLLASIEAARRQSDPNSLLNRPTRVFVRDVTGAPGDGNTSLTRRMRESLPKLGEVVQETVDGSDFTVEGTVRTSRGPAGQTTVEIAWTVTDVTGEAGKASQLQDVPSEYIAGPWGDLAVVVAEQAAAGVKEIIDRRIGLPAAGSGGGEPGTATAAPPPEPGKPQASP